MLVYVKSGRVADAEGFESGLKGGWERGRRRESAG